MLATAIAGLTAVAGVYAYAGLYGFNAFLRRGGSIWATVTPNDPQISAAMGLALHEPVPAVTAGSFAWQHIADGFDVAELPVLAGDQEIDRLLLSRLDPARFRFVVRTSPGDKELSDWMRELRPAMVINGSYFTRYGVPDTPLISAGVRWGPDSYDARHGAFVATA